jgi:hypothetical protein
VNRAAVVPGDHGPPLDFRSTMCLDIGPLHSGLRGQPYGCLPTMEPLPTAHSARDQR